MFSRGLRQFFIEEIAQLNDESFVIPHNWIIRGEELSADCSDVCVSGVSTFFFSFMTIA